MYSAGITASGNRNTCFRECHMNHKMNGQAGFTLIELIVVIVILGILAVTAAPKFMNLTSDANASVVKGLSGSIKSAYQMVYAKSRLHTSDRIVCAQTETSLDVSKDGVIAVTSKGYPVSSTAKLTGTTSDITPTMKNTIAGAVDLGISWDDYDNLDKTDGTNPADWIILSNDDGYAFVPKSAPASAKTDKAKYSSSQDDSTSTCGVFYKATDADSAPTVKVFVKGC